MVQNLQFKCRRSDFLAREPLDFYCRYDLFVLWCWPWCILSKKIWGPWNNFKKSLKKLKNVIFAKFYASFSSNFETESCLIFCPQTFFIYYTVLTNRRKKFHCIYLKCHEFPGIFISLLNILFLSFSFLKAIEISVPHGTNQPINQSINQFILEKELIPFGIWLLNIYRILQ